MKKYQSFLPENFQFLEVKFSLYLIRRVFVMSSDSHELSHPIFFEKISKKTQASKCYLLQL